MIDADLTQGNLSLVALQLAADPLPQLLDFTTSSSIGCSTCIKCRQLKELRSFVLPG